MGHDYSAIPSTMLIGDCVGIRRDMLKPDALSNVRYSASVRSQPPVITIMLRSRKFLKGAVGPSPKTVSTITTLPPGAIALRILLRIAAHSWSFQSCRIIFKGYRSPPAG